MHLQRRLLLRLVVGSLKLVMVTPRFDCLYLRRKKALPHFTLRISIGLVVQMVKSIVFCVRKEHLIFSQSQSNIYPQA
jgi:hypothetical protein